MKKKKFISIILASFFIFFVNINFTYAITSLSEPRYQGIDVSNWQGFVDYARVKESGIEIVYIKSSQGDNIIDPDFERNYTNAKQNNLQVGVYHFLTAKDTNQARSEAEFFCSVISEKQIDCKLAMDFEELDGLSKREINDISRAFLDRVKDLTKKELVIYSDLSNAQDNFDKDLADEYPLWLAYYGDYNELNNVSTNWNNWIGVQYTDRGNVPGTSGNVDRDLFTEEIFLSDKTKINKTKPTDVTPHTPRETKEVSHVVFTVKRGDTLWAIARKYGVTVNHIVALNNIQNPNLIFPGEKLRITNNDKLIPDNEKKENYTPRTYIIKRGDTLSEIALKFRVSVNYLVRLNNIKNPDLIYAGNRLFI